MNNEKIKNILNKLGIKHDEHYISWMSQPNVMCEHKTPSEFIEAGREEELLSMLEGLHNSEAQARNRKRKEYVKRDANS